MYLEGTFETQRTLDAPSGSSGLSNLGNLGDCFEARALCQGWGKVSDNISSDLFGTKTCGEWQTSTVQEGVSLDL